MKTVKLGFSILLIALVSFACKKKKDEPASPSTTPTTTYPTIGQVTASYMYIDMVSAGMGISLDSTATARFSESQSSSTTINAGTVTLNGVQLDNMSNSYYSPSSTPLNINNALTWSVTGSGTLSAFSHSFMPSYAKYTGGSLLPDSCIKSSGITLNITGVTNSPSLPLKSTPIMVSVSQGTVFAYKTMSGTSGTVSFSPSEISGMTTNSFFYVMINFQNYKLERIGDVSHQFNTSLYYMKYVYLK